MEDYLIQQNLKITHAEMVQSLWSGYGSIQRYHLRNVDDDDDDDDDNYDSKETKESSELQSLIAKEIEIPRHELQKGGIGNQRKIQSYKVEQAFYELLAQTKKEQEQLPRTAALYATGSKAGNLLLLEDLDAVGYRGRRMRCNVREAKACLRWLAEMHTAFLGYNAKRLGLWSTGCYWHLATRPDEYGNMRDDDVLKLNAKELDDALENAKYKTIIHGDAKVANFCFTENGEDVAAVDFQYTGGGIGTRDVAYCLGSMFGDEGLYGHHQELLEYYFSQARWFGLPSHVEDEWRKLYPICYADFERFLAGWNPNHWKRGKFAREMTKVALDLLQEELE